MALAAGLALASSAPSPAYAAPAAHIRATRPAPGRDRAHAAAAPSRLSRADAAFLDSLQQATFRWFRNHQDPVTGLTDDRAPTPSFASISAVGFALTAWPIGVAHGWITRAEARERTLRTLRFFARSVQDTTPDATGYRGFYYHFLDMHTGRRFRDVELSTVDTALLMGGVLFCASWFDRADAQEREIRATAESLYARVDWRWAQPRPPSVCHGWTPEHGFLPYDWRGYDEAMIVYVLALGSPTHGVDPAAWGEWTSTYRWGTFEGLEQLGFAPLFGHQYSQVWLDLRGVHDEFMRAHHSTYFENSRRATLAQRAYAIRDSAAFRDYGASIWGLTACDGPLDSTLTLDGRARELHSYWPRGASFTTVRDDGTIAPAAAGGALPFAPEVAIPALRAMRARYGADVYGPEGFVDAFNPTLRVPLPNHAGHVNPALGWFDVDRLGIDQGPILAMAENLRTGLVWRTLRRNPHVVRGLKRAGFRGGWLDRVAAR
ncbi:MAG TPA: glucoamylase family protein [Candidatus Eisenbacteria bacterium]|nr:glucoamylase family protein [Candidatus Eisenbacteria bacterium]